MEIFKRGLDLVEVEIRGSDVLKASPRQRHKWERSRKDIKGGKRE